MKHVIKTFAEYKKLVQEHDASDSLSRMESIEDAIYSKAKSLLHELIVLYAKYGRDYVNNSCSSNIREYGCLQWLSLGEFDESKVELCPSDYWGYNGIEVQMKYLDSEEFEALEKKLRKERVWFVKGKLQEKIDAIEKLKKEAEKLETEIEELEAKLEVE